MWHSTQLTIASLFFNAVFTLLVFVLVNLLFQKFLPRLAMSQADLQTLYVMVVMLTTISGHTMMGYLIPVLAHAFQFASPENEWIPLFGHHIPTWIAIKSPRILDGFYNGDSTLYTPTTLDAWIPPVLAWSSFVIALWLTLLGGNRLSSEAMDGKRTPELSDCPTPISIDKQSETLLYFSVDVARLCTRRECRIAQRLELSVPGYTVATHQRKNHRAIQFKAVECDGTDSYLFLSV